MSAFNTKCIMDKMRDSTNLEDNYQKVRNIPSLLVCNQNGHERIQKGLLESSVLLGANFKIEENNCLNQNYNDKIYGRNVPIGNIPVNVDMRAIPAGHCVDPRFQKERTSLEKYNKYEVNMECNDKDIFMPNKGTVSGYFNNIDLDSELKNINQIDTKCSKRFFKVNPENKKSKLGCYKDVLVKDYQNCENDAGYTWCKLNKCTNHETFPVCDKKEYTCAISKESRENAKVLNKEDILIVDGEQSVGKNVNGFNNRELQSGQLIDQQKINDALLDLQLLEKKKQMVINNFLEKETYPKQNNIHQFKANGHTNIYAPIIQKREHNLENVEQLGYNKGINKALDIRIENKLKEIEVEEERNRRLLRELEAKNKRIEEQKKCDPLRQYSPSVSSIHIDRYAKFSNSNVYDVKCRGQTKKLYKFNNLVSDDRDCQYCEQVFNNQTKRKHISIGNVPQYILNQK